MSKARIILEVDQLTAGYVSSMMIIEDVSISVREGEIVTILGPNGAGKSTLIRSICGLVKYTEGKVRFRSKEISGLSTHEIINQAIAYVPQTNNVFSRLMLALARALMSNPELLMLDEPSAGLSPLLRRQVFEHVQRIHEDGVTVVMVEQNARAALKVSDRGIVLSEGKLRLEGPADELLEHPSMREIYFGAAPGN